ncbi:MAG: hypothetical protein Kow00122_05750 [Thermoleophilia bacterium]
MDERIRDRRRSVARARGRRRALVLLVVLLGAALTAGYFWLGSSSVFAVRRVSLPVTRHVTEAELREAVRAVAGVNLLRLSPADVERRLLLIPYVRSARVYRRFPDMLEVQVTEFEPVARVQARDGKRWVIGEGGRVLEPATEAMADLPLFVPAGETWPRVGGTAPPQVVEALPILPLLRDPGVWFADQAVARILVSDVGELVLVLAPGGEVRLGEPAELKAKLMAAAEIIDRYSREGRSLEYVDVHVPSRVVAKAKGP